MRSRALRRRSATVLGVYLATALGFLTTVFATRELGTGDYARFAAIVAATAFLQLLLDLTVEEALVKYGFRYMEAGLWGRLRRIFEVALAFKLVGGLVGGIALALLAPFIGQIWGVDDIVVPMLIAACIPVLQAPEGVVGGAVILRGRYDIRGGLLATSMALRLAGIAIGAMYGLTGAVLGMVIGQLIATIVFSVVGLAAFRRFPQVPSEPLGDDRRAVRGFVFSSTISSSLLSARTTLGTALMPVVAPIDQAGFYRNAQAPATGFSALSAPARLVLLTEQTRDYEAGRHTRMYGMLRRYIVGTTGLMILAVPVLWILMPFLMGLAYGPTFREHATDAARLVLIAASLQLIWGWTKSFPVSIGRPEPAPDRAVGRDRGVRPAAARVRVRVGRDRRCGRDGRLDGRVLRALVRAPRTAASRPRGARGRPELRVVLVSGIWPPDVGGPASHGPEVAAFLRGRGHEVEAVITADAAPPPAGYPVRWVSRSLPVGVRHAQGVRLVAARARRADAVYTTGMFGRSSLGSMLARTPYVAKLTADGAYERARRLGLWHGSLEEFQRPARCARRRSAQRATSTSAAPLTSSRRRRTFATSRSAGAFRRSAPPCSPTRRRRCRSCARATSCAASSASTGRRSFRRPARPQKSLELGIEAARHAGVALAIAGDGPERASLERLGHARFLGPIPRQAVLELFRAGDASLLSSSWENFPHTRRRGARGRDARDRDADRRRRRGRARRRERARGGAGRHRRARRSRSTASSPTTSSPRGCARTPPPRSPTTRRPRLRPARGDLAAGGGPVTPRVLFVGRTRYRLPLPPGLARKWDALSERWRCGCSAAESARTRVSRSCRRGGSTDRATTPGCRRASPASCGPSIPTSRSPRRPTRRSRSSSRGG